MNNIKYLGYVIKYVGIYVDLENILILKDWPIPKNIHELRRFLGLVKFYQQIVLVFSDIA